MSWRILRFLRSFHLSWSPCCLLNKFEHCPHGKRGRFYWVQCLPMSLCPIRLTWKCAFHGPAFANCFPPYPTRAGNLKTLPYAGSWSIYLVRRARVCVFGERGQCTFLPRYHINMKLQGGQILQWKPWEFAVNISRAPRLHYCSR